MKPLIEKLPLQENTSFLATTYRTPYFEVPWHQHIEYELIYFREGEGRSYVGNHAGDFKTGDIFFLGSNLPHTFQKANAGMVASALVIQFKEEFMGPEFMQLPETRRLKTLFGTSSKGLKLTGSLKEQLIPFVEELEFAEGFERLLLLFESLQMICGSYEYKELSTQEVTEFNKKNKERIDKVFQYTIDHYQDNVLLDNVALHAGMSVPAFCSYFKKSTKKTYIQFLNEVRIAHTCRQLIDTQQSIENICYDSGFNTIAHFNKQFMRLKGATPTKYRKDFMKRNHLQKML